MATFYITLRHKAKYIIDFFSPDKSRVKFSTRREGREGAERRRNRKEEEQEEQEEEILELYIAVAGP